MPSGERSPLRRTRLMWAVGLTVLLGAGAVWPVAPLREGDTWAAVADGHLRMSPTFLAFAPVNNTLDALSLLSVREHVAVLAAVVALFLAWRVRRIRQRSGVPSRGVRRVRRVLREAGVATGLLLVLVGVYAAMILVPRPMAALGLTAADSDLVTIDFHSHTTASHDGRPGFTAERNRAWHRAAGFDVAYVTDHFTFEGAEAAARNNPVQSGDGTALFSGIESLEGGEHVNVLGVTAVDYAMFHGRYLAVAGVRAAVQAGRIPPVVLQTIPGPLDRVPRPDMPSLVPVGAIEVSDGAPRGLSSSDRDHAQILHVADSLGLAIVGGSDNHGWGQTAAEWTVMRVAGWRRLPPNELERQIEDGIRAHGRQASRVIVRTRPIWIGRPAAHGVVAAAGALEDSVSFLAQFIWQLFATRSWPERLAWLLWIWVVALVPWRPDPRVQPS